MKIEFASSRQSTLGVEWELALVDAETGELASVANQVLRGVAARHPELNEDDEHPHIKQELLLNTVELVTGICTTVAEAKADLSSSLAAVRDVTDPMGVEIFCAGSHPFSPPQLQPVTDKARYAKLIDRTQWWGRQMVIYGVHVHVGLDSRDKVLPVLDGLVNYFPHFQALSASSPFWGGEDTGYASHRALMFQQLPTAGLPFQFASWEDYESYVQDMFTTGVIDTLSEIRWDIRPVPALRHHRDAHLRRPGDPRGRRRDRRADAVPCRRIFHHAGKRRHHSHDAALARAGKQVARGPVRPGRDHHPRRRRATSSS